MLVDEAPEAVAGVLLDLMHHVGRELQEHRDQAPVLQPPGEKRQHGEQEQSPATKPAYIQFWKNQILTTVPTRRTRALFVDHVVAGFLRAMLPVEKNGEFSKDGGTGVISTVSGNDGGST